MSKPIMLKAVVRIIGVNPYVLISAEEAALLYPNWRKPLPVVVAINCDRGRSWPTNMMPKGDGNFYLYLHGQMRKAAGVEVGGKVTIEVSFNETYKNGPLHPMPRWFQAALKQNKSARANWQKLPPSRQKELLRYFAGLKSDEAKQRNLARAIQALEGAPTHFMGRDWVDGR